MCVLRLDLIMENIEDMQVKGAQITEFAPISTLQSVLREALRTSICMDNEYRFLGDWMLIALKNTKILKAP